MKVIDGYVVTVEYANWEFDQDYGNDFENRTTIIYGAYSDLETAINAIDKAHFRTLADMNPEVKGWVDQTAFEILDNLMKMANSKSSFELDRFVQDYTENDEYHTRTMIFGNDEDTDINPIKKLIIELKINKTLMFIPEKLMEELK